MSVTFSRPQTFSMAKITARQLDYMIELGIVDGDVGDGRRRFSISEVRLACVAGYLLNMKISPLTFKGLIGWLRPKLPHALSKAQEEKRNVWLHVENPAAEQPVFFLSATAEISSKNPVGCILINVTKLLRDSFSLDLNT